MWEARVKMGSRRPLATCCMHSSYRSGAAAPSLVFYGVIQRAETTTFAHGLPRKAVSPTGLLARIGLSSSFARNTARVHCAGSKVQVRFSYRARQCTFDPRPHTIYPGDRA